MKFTIFLLCAISATFALPLDEQRVDVTQDTAGNYNYIIKTGDFSKMEQRNPDGSVVGEFSFVDAEGKLQTTKYTSGVEGFQVRSGPIPVAPVAVLAPIGDTPEVRAAKEAFFTAFNALKH